MNSSNPPPWVTADIPVDPWVANRKQDVHHTLQGYIHRETEKAILFEIIQLNGSPLGAPGTEGKKEWFPLSQTKSITRPAPSETSHGEYDNITITHWIAKQKGLPV